MFLDPPYLEAKIKTYRGWTELEMRQFADEVKKLQSKWIVTVDDSPLNRELWADYHYLAVETANGAVNRAQSSATFGELIIYSHRPRHTAAALQAA